VILQRSPEWTYVKNTHSGDEALRIHQWISYQNNQTR